MKGLGMQQYFLEEENESPAYLESTFEPILYAFANKAEEVWLCLITYIL